MDEYIMREILNHRGMSDSEFIRRMKEVLGSDRTIRRDSRRGDFIDDDMYRDRYYVNRHSDSQLSGMMDELDSYDKEKLFKMLLAENNGGHFNEDSAKSIVLSMYHTSSGRKFMGEKYDMSKAKEIYARYRGIIPSDATVADVYVALNAHYHDFCDLYKAWFGDNIDGKIVESAINFWFKDDDYKGTCKVFKYYRGA